MKTSNRIIGHHILQRKFGGSNHPDNIHYRDEVTERAYHHLFPVGWELPALRISRILEMDASAYRDAVAERLYRVIGDIHDLGPDAYKPTTLKKRNVFTNFK